MFNNVQNKTHVVEGNRTIWESRAPAVVGACILYSDESSDAKILLVKRGPGCPNEVDKWCIPCGFLDWNESGTDGARREVYEEAGLLLTKEAGWKYDDNPWRVAHWPTTPAQNISMHFSFWKLLESGEEPPALSFQNSEYEEITDVVWKDVGEAVNMELAFGHQHVIRMLADDACIPYEVTT